MKIYTHTGDGVALGSTTVVMADSLDTAIKLIKDNLTNNGLDYEDDDIIAEEVPKHSKIIYFDNGDY